MRLYMVSRWVDGRQWYLDIDGRQTHVEERACVFRSVREAARQRDRANVDATADGDPRLWYVIGWTKIGRTNYGKGSTDQREGS